MMNYKVIIPAAGKASRLKPLSSSMSKSMVPVNGKPIISYILDQLFELGNPFQIVIVENELGDIQDFVKNAYPNYYEESRILFATQKERLGPLHAIEIGANRFPENDNMPIMVWLGDTICLEMGELPVNESLLITSPVADYKRWCLVDNENVFYDKPDNKPSTNQALIGIYYFHDFKAFYEALDKGMQAPMIKDEHQISALLEAYKKQHIFKIRKTDEWFDCGELHTFYESKARLLGRSARSFNSLEVNTFHNTITKSSLTFEGKLKIENEKNWYLGLPENIQILTPRVLKSNSGTLVMSQEPGTPLNEMWLYEDLTDDTWKRIIDKTLLIHNKIFYQSRYIPKSSKLDRFAARKEMYLTKNIDRLTEISFLPFAQKNIKMIRDFVRVTGELLIEDEGRWSPHFHGDSHMGNILFEPLQGSMKFLDPRGKFGNIVGIEGDMYYDMAKIAQDFLLRYPEILSGHYHFSGDNFDQLEFYRNDERSKTMLKHFRKRIGEYGYIPNLVLMLATVLIITCIPFHKDDPERQKAFWYMAVNVIKERGWNIQLEDHLKKQKLQLSDKIHNLYNL